MRADIYELLMDEQLEKPEKSREYMQKAYVTFSTIASVPSEDGAAVRSKWADLVHEVAVSHGKYIGEFQEGKFYASIEQDPRDSIEADEKVDLKSLPQY